MLKGSGCVNSTNYFGSVEVNCSTKGGVSGGKEGVSGGEEGGHGDG